MTNQLSPKARLIRLIQIAKRELGMDDETYRAILMEIGNEDSSTKLTVSELEQVLEHMKKCGFKVVPKSKKIGKMTMANDEQSKMIRGLWLELHNLGAVQNPSEYSLSRYVKRITGIDLLQWTTAKQKSKVIETLKKWLDRVLEKDLKNES
ncbi:gp16 family protein [Oligella urethralis]|uniref:gp16 family protein n=1 Tax=Oligella urethralis TaxID=90245 RepID=UPI00288A6F46|nr:regulatory protein GemA [Oligella urethralis]